MNGLFVEYTVINWEQIYYLSKISGTTITAFVPGRGEPGSFSKNATPHLAPYF